MDWKEELVIKAISLATAVINLALALLNYKAKSGRKFKRRRKKKPKK